MKKIRLDITCYDKDSEFYEVLQFILNSDIGFEKLQQMESFLGYYFDSISIGDCVLNLKGRCSLVAVSWSDEIVVFHGNPNDILAELKGIRLVSLVVEGVNGSKD